MDSVTQTNELKMKIGDLVKRKETEQFFIYSGTGMWAGWGEFANFEGRKSQIQMISMVLAWK